MTSAMFLMIGQMVIVLTFFVIVLAIDRRARARQKKNARS